MITKRVFDVSLSLIALLLLFPVFLIIACLISFDSPGGVFYRQTRVGKDKIDFELIKFRTMVSGASRLGQLTVGFHDPRITRVGFWLRKYKLDELPQLLNVLKGDMSFVGPRPEVRRYVELYNDQQQRVFDVRPGLTDWASIQFCNENELLAKAKDPENYYVQKIIPVKLSQNLAYIDHHDLRTDLLIMALTLRRIVFNK